MAKAVRVVFVSAIFLALLCIGMYAFARHSGVAKATYSEVTTIVGVDVDPTGNTATSLGTIDRCISVSPNATFNIDLFIMDVTDLNEWGGVFTYDQSKLEVSAIDVNLFLKKNPASGNVYKLFDCSAPGSCTLGAVDQASAPYAPDTGSGVLGRLTVKAKAGASGASRAYFGQLKPLSFITLAEPGSVPIGDLNSDNYFDGLAFNAIVKVGSPCPVEGDLDGLDGFNYVEESIDGSDLLDADSTPEMCDGVDNDLDGLTDEWYDRSPANGTPDCGDTLSDTDGDGTANPSDSDDDDDGYSDELEAYMATDSLADCALTPYHSAWPPDIDNDTQLTVTGDVFQFIGIIGVTPDNPNFRRRLDFDMSGDITVTGDVFVYVQQIGSSCS